jgi:hypothetical protein
MNPRACAGNIGIADARPFPVRSPSERLKAFPGPLSIDVRHAQTQVMPLPDRRPLGRGLPAGEHDAMLRLKGGEMTQAQSRMTARQRNAKIVRRLRNTSLTLEAVGAEFGLTRQRIQQIAKGAGITWERRRRAIISRMGNES